MIPDYKNILVINTMHIGDLMLVTDRKSVV